MRMAERESGLVKRTNGQINPMESERILTGAIWAAGPLRVSLIMVLISRREFGETFTMMFSFVWVTVAVPPVRTWEARIFLSMEGNTRGKFSGFKRCRKIVLPLWVEAPQVPGLQSLCPGQI